MENYYKVFKDWYWPLTEAKCIDVLDQILSNLDALYELSTVYPYKNQVFRAFDEVPYEKLKVIFLGQDPYHNTNVSRHTSTQGKEIGKLVVPNACGRSFLTENGFYPPSLENLFRELKNDKLAHSTPIRAKAVEQSSLEGYNFDNWINQGVMMLNIALTVEAGKPKSHSKIWENWSLRLVHYLANNRKDIVWILLGKDAKDLLWGYNIKKVEAIHPSPLAGKGFMGSKIYSRTNDLLKNPIIW